MTDEKPHSPFGTKGKMANGSIIWGLRFSFFRLALILFMIGMMAIRYAMLPDDTSSGRPSFQTTS